ncbi:outer membrane beta-barrel protein [Vibrio pacinii]|uniref:outer membrane beta-barrel protein n=1 Tax=Vibrio pacinii TaxID=170674 RepID=UPI00056E97A3|nr:outer membrane beta-barrel protein [Vibrio pacinii]
MQKNKIAILVSVLLSTGVTVGFAEASEFYVGGKLGAAIFDDPCSANSLSCDDVSGGASVYGGYQLNDWLAVEGGYDYLGGPLATYPAIGQPSSSVDYDALVQGIELGLKADYALNDRVVVFGKGGTFLWQLDKEANEPVVGSVSDSGTGASLMLGTGAEYRLSPNWITRLEYQYINGVGDDVTGSSDVHFVSLGLNYRFGASSTHTPLVVSEPVVEKVQQEVKPEVKETVSPPKQQVIETYTQILSATNSEALFESDSTKITPALKMQLMPVLARLQKYPDTTVEVTGHTDSVGDANYNQSLSVVRAQSVADYLAAQGIDRSRIIVKGFGELRPIASNKTVSGRAHNRRVEIVMPEVVIETETTKPVQ